MIHHNSRESKYRTPFGAVKTGSVVHLCIDANNALSVFVRSWTDETKEVMYPMEKHGESFSVDITMPKTSTLFWYFFVVNYEDKTVCYGNNRKALGGTGEVYVNEEPQSFQITVFDEYSSPSWYKDSVIYQIFPDRFYKSENAGIPDEVLMQRRMEDWNSDPYYIKNEDGSIKEWNFWGGNLKGIEEKLPYLSSLGISAIYLNPIFESKSNHRYDTSDYFKVDPLLGTNDDFKSLCNKAKEFGIKIILDGVFSHTGIESKYYEEHRDWYTGGFWWGVKNLPEVDENNPGFTNLICGKDGVLKHWLRLGASGFRLDVADELPDEFLENVRHAIKEENPDAVLIGEVWEDASNKISYGHRRRFLLGKQLDGVMNYPLRDAVIALLNNQIDAYEFSDRMNCLFENYPKEAFYSNFNLIGSHDRERIINALGFDKEKQKLASVLSYVLPGAPVIYYGDEAGLMGSADPDNRRTFPWGKEDAELTAFYKTLCHEYSMHQELKSGDFTVFATHSDEVIITRTLNGKSAKIVINTNTKKYDITYR